MKSIPYRSLYLQLKDFSTPVFQPQFFYPDYFSTLIFLFLVGILRLQDGCDYSALISKEEQIIIPENAGDTEAEIEKEKANKDDNSDDVEQGKGLNLSKLV